MSKPKYLQGESLLDEWTLLTTDHGSRRVKRFGYNRGDIERLLRMAVTMPALVDLYRENPDAFDFNKLTTEQRVLMLSENYEIFKDKIDIAALPKKNRVDLFISKPNVFKKFIDFEDLTKELLQRIAIMRPSYFVKYKLPVAKLNQTSWLRLIKHKPEKYVDLFVENIPNLRSKTELRTIFEKNPKLLTVVTVDAAQHSVLTAKEWILLINWKDVRKTPYTYKEDVIEWLEIESSVEVLSGSAASRQMKLALKRMKGKDMISEATV